MGAAFGRLVGEVVALIFPSGISFFGSHTNPIVPGGYAVVGAAAFGGAVTHTISTTVIVFELTGQLSHIIPCIIAVLISNAIAQNLESNIYDSIIQIKKLPFLPNISSTSTTAHEIVAGHIMVRDVIFVWFKCTYRDIKKIIKEHRQIQSFPVVDSPDSMILLGSIQRQELQLAISRSVLKTNNYLFFLFNSTLHFFHSLSPSFPLSLSHLLSPQTLVLINATFSDCLVIQLLLRGIST